MTDRDKRTLMIGGIVIGVLLVGYLLFNLLGGGGGEEEATSTAPRPTSTVAGGDGGSISETPSLTPSAVLVLPVRDPFSAPPGFSVSTSTSSGSTGSSTGSTSTTTSSSSTSTGSGTGTGSTSGATPPTQPGNGASDSVGGHTVVLLDTFTTNGVEQAQVEVDGTVYRVSAGENFGPNNQYRLQSVSGNCATFLYGDESFTLCVPQNK